MNTTSFDTPAVSIEPWEYKKPRETQGIYNYTCGFFTPTIYYCVYTYTFYYVDFLGYVPESKDEFFY